MASARGAGLGADMLQDVLRRKLVEQAQMAQQQQQAQKLAEEIRQANMQNDVQQRSLGQGDRKIDLDTSKHGEDVRQFDAQAPLRIANVAHLGASTNELLRKPTAEQQERDFISTRDKTQHGFDMTEIGARGSQDRQTLASRPPAGVQGGWQLKEISDAKTNTTKLVRVNDVTGEVQEIGLPDGFQPGGQRQKNLSVGQQEDLATMETVQKLSAEAARVGAANGWRGVGGLGQGTVGRLAMQHLGKGDPKDEELRNYIGNIQGTIAKLRGGTAFSAQEKAMLDTYTPTINDNPKAIQAKLSSLGTFINAKRESTMKYAGAGAGQPSAPQDDTAKRAADLLKKYGGG